jgi:tRNA(Ile)-lysidine synthase
MAEELSAQIVEAILPQKINTIYLGYSGGMDSHVLLHLLAQSRFHQQVCAVHIHHGLQNEADEWGEHCRRQAERLKIRYQLIYVDASPENRQSPEEAARNARYTAFRELVQQHDVLMLAQHREDQLETVLLQLFRGAGVAGLAGMPERKVFGQGLMIRPLLDVAQQTLRQYARKHQLNWIEDPSNQCLNFERNFLRQQIIPQLKQHWPGLDKTVSRSARHCATTDGLMHSVTLSHYQAVCDEKEVALDIAALQALSAGWRNQVLRYWFKQAGLNYPSETILQQIQTDIIDARQDATPQISTQQHQVRRYRGKLYLVAEQIIEAKKIWCWQDTTQSLPLDNGKQLEIILANSGIPVSVWEKACITVGYRQGGEKIRLPGRKGRHELKKLFQEAGVPPWLRNQIPLIYIDDQLAAVANYWISADFYQQQKNACYQIVF